ncbi:MAG: hypothetical protein K5686_07825 [Lachnospiraceae bacterium]|nr:hypothetical protein [Lachnospiraceae bacterium]
MMREWRSFKELFAELNKECNYLVLRNYQDISDDGKAVSGHEDIDFLCDDIDKLEAVCGGTPRKKKNDRIHQKIKVNGVEIPVDIRTVGDGYYDPAWEVEMLKNRRKYKELLYIMDEKNELYSLIYHVIIQKNSISADYAKKLADMAGIPEFTEAYGIKELEDYMRERGYKYTYPEYPGGIFHREKGAADLREVNPARAVRRFLHRYIR